MTWWMWFIAGFFACLLAEFGIVFGIGLLNEIRDMQRERWLKRQAE